MRGVADRGILAADTRARLAGRPGLEKQLAQLLGRMTAGERRAFYLGAGLGDGTVEHQDALRAWIAHEDPDLVALLVELPAAPGHRPAIVRVVEPAEPKPPRQPKPPRPETITCAKCLEEVPIKRHGPIPRACAPCRSL